MAEDGDERLKRSSTSVVDEEIDEEDPELPQEKGKLFSCIQTNIPITKWLPKYKCSYLANDLLCGVFLTLHHIPQGMAYVHLAGVPAYFGLYMAIIHELIISMLGGIPYISLGAASIPCLLAGEIVFNQRHRSDADNLEIGNEATYTKEADLAQLMAALSLCIGTLHVAFWAINVGAVSQIFQPVFMIAPWLLKISIPFPAEFVIMIMGAVISHGMQLTEDKPIGYGVFAINPPPLGFKFVELPNWEMYFQMFKHGMLLAFIAFAITVEIEGISQEGNMDDTLVNTDRFLLAQGFANFFGAFFGCPPTCPSHHRSSVVEVTGAKTPLAGTSCALLMLIPIYCCIDRLEPLPLPILGSIEFVLNLKLMGGWFQLINYWRESKKNAVFWLFTCLATIATNLTYGFIVGVLISLKRLFLSTERDTEELIMLRQLESLHETETDKDIQEPGTSKTE